MTTIPVTEHASFLRRVGALLVDGLIIGALASIVTSDAIVNLPVGNMSLRLGMPESWTAPGGWFGPRSTGWFALSVVLWVLYDALLHARVGRTPGKALVGVAVVGTDGARLTLAQSFVRSLVKFTVSAGVLYLGYLWAAWDPRRQAWHDKAAKSLVVATRRPVR